MRNPTYTEISNELGKLIHGNRGLSTQVAEYLRDITAYQPGGHVTHPRHQELLDLLEVLEEAIRGMEYFRENPHIQAQIEKEKGYVVASATVSASASPRSVDGLPEKLRQELAQAELDRRARRRNNKPTYGWEQ